MNLEERLLEDILCGGSRSEEADQEVEQLVPLAAQKLRKGVLVTLDMGSQELFVGLLGQD